MGCFGSPASTAPVHGDLFRTAELGQTQTIRAPGAPAFDQAGEEKDQIVGQRCRHGHLGRGWQNDKLQGKKPGQHPGDVFDPHAQDEKEEDFVVRRDGGEGEEEGKIEEGVRRGAAEEKGRHGAADHPREVKDIELERAPTLLQRRGQKPHEHEKEEEPEPAVGMRDENVSDQPPHFALHDLGRIEHQHAGIRRLHLHQHEGQRIEQDHRLEDPRRAQPRHADLEKSPEFFHARPRHFEDGFCCQGQRPLISSSSEKLRKVRMMTMAPSTAIFCKVGDTATVLMMSPATSNSRPSKMARPKFWR